jgi:hypothetical protein
MEVIKRLPHDLKYYIFKYYIVKTFPYYIVKKINNVSFIKEWLKRYYKGNPLSEISNIIVDYPELFDDIKPILEYHEQHKCNHCNDFMSCVNDIYKDILKASCIHGNIEVVKWLYDNKRNGYIGKDSWYSATMLACKNDNRQITIFLVNNL